MPTATHTNSLTHHLRKSSNNLTHYIFTIDPKWHPIRHIYFMLHQIEWLRDHILHSPPQVLLRRSLPRDHSSFIFPCPKSTSSKQTAYGPSSRRITGPTLESCSTLHPLQGCHTLSSMTLICVHLTVLLGLSSSRTKTAPHSPVCSP